MFTISTVTQRTSDTGHPLLLLQSNHGDKYLIGNVSEGAQRAVTENKIRLSKLSNIFLTGQLDWFNVGGLPGLILTIADQGREKLCLHYGSPLLDYVVATWRSFIFRFRIGLSNRIAPEDPYRDDVVEVTTHCIRSGAGETHLSRNSFLRSIVGKMFPRDADPAATASQEPFVNVNLPQVDLQQSTTCYEIAFKPIRGKFKVQEAIKLGVPKGPSFAILAKGGTVTLDSGAKVTPEQVLESQRKFAKILVVDIPDNSYLSELYTKFKGYDATDLGVVYYFLADSVVISPELLKFMELFHGNSSVNHIVSHKNLSLNNIAFRGSAVTTLKLKSLQNTSYNLPRVDQLFSKDFYDCFQINTPEGCTVVQENETPLSSSIPRENIHVLSKHTTVTISPFTPLRDPLHCDITAAEDTFSWEHLYNEHIKPLELPSKPTYEKLITQEIDINHFNSGDSNKEDHVEIVTLGTGSALPSKYRNVISTLLKVPFRDTDGQLSQRMVLLDAGENTMGTLNRMFSSCQVRDIFQNLKLMYLSHLHADHHLGIVSILLKWYEVNRDIADSRLFLVVPWQYNNFVREWLKLEAPEVLSRITYISNEHFISGTNIRLETKPLNWDELELSADGSRGSPPKKKRLDESSSFRDLVSIRELYKKLHMKQIQTCRAIHCNWAYSSTMEFELDAVRSFKVSYSGDTRPNVRNFANGIGQGSDLLIHEATLDNELTEDAVKKRHCTINEAIEVSNAMRAKKLILTHFSQRYPKAPSVDGNLAVFAREYCFAFDGMIIDYEILGDQMSILPYLGKVFVEEQKEEEETAGEGELVDT
ncbi:tRNase Z KNAG_0C06430 [Huiozyma naganishii CBS 8797]|uniref:ribonuclease Z n=1 Tax=Huiozyma naganishii (strain ATCC MYA-139 / BCRC 22969 / CBS 8797 / KCTC 17520 / NBRC 10181 / NCYC 3082 / Yp74L-3) TaxID=1071383 RepID=J7S6F8_HUIN7|nr:hypothetical protein KNAG_0C06430 [Kazachstania naganishii CBS 8797]CCK69736.1 hypothetical protein KNAG_0C06430 [Kazachstania naganishii CBS 8797]